MRTVEDGCLTVAVTIGCLDDAGGGCVFVVADDWPELVGHGADEEEAIDDLQAQFDAITWH